jgi:hypothetical protein
MKNNNQPARYNHKSAGAVVLLESTAELAKVLIPGSGDEFWVKLTDLTQLAGGVIEESKPDNKKLGKAARTPHRTADTAQRVSHRGH